MSVRVVVVVEIIFLGFYFFSFNLIAFFDCRKDYETGKLNSGLLQLAPHTHLVLDEIQLEPGKLESHGIEAVVHLSNLIRKQQLNVNFKFYTIDYNANIPVLILSEGKSMFPVSVSFEFYALFLRIFATFLLIFDAYNILSIFLCSFN